ncbi:hypothetical protein HOY80DRAFT_1138910 [Tuber brumale]|nr:hypothetical protein HOY80DRAFT_1138910 [Tuber brumale]
MAKPTRPSKDRDETPSQCLSAITLAFPGLFFWTGVHIAHHQPSQNIAFQPLNKQIATYRFSAWGKDTYFTSDVSEIPKLKLSNVGLKIALPNGRARTKSIGYRDINGDMAGQDP